MHSFKNWLLRQLNANDALDGIDVTVKFAVTELGSKTVVRELRRLADYLERTGEVPGWKFPATSAERLKTRTRQAIKPS